MRYITTIFFSITIVIAGCVKEYAVPGTKYNDMIVIDGILTDKGQAQVRMTHSYEAAKKQTRRCTGADVTITDSDGQVFKLEEDKYDQGMYRLAPRLLTAQIGKTYQLRATYDGITYLSAKEEMLAVPEITNMSFDYSEDNDGVWVSASTLGNNDDTRYFAWAYEETWKFRTPYVSERLLNHLICYTKLNSKGIFTATTETLTDNRLDNSRVYFISFDNDRLGMRYSTLLKLQSISRDTYRYLEHAKKLNFNNGSLFDPIPTSVNGNILSENGTVAALGNFQVSAESHCRFYIDYQDLKPGQRVMWASDICELESVGITDTAKIKEIKDKGWAFKDTLYGIYGEIIGLEYTNFGICFDCMSTGASNVPPSWWDELPTPVK